MIKPIFKYPTNNIAFRAHYFITGHKNPDLDSVASSVAIAYLAENAKKGKGHTFEAVAAGKINREAEFALSSFGLSSPSIKTDLRMTVAEVMKDKSFSETSVKQNSTIRDFINVTDDNKVKSLAVLDDDNHVVGMVTSQSLSAFVRQTSKGGCLSKLKEYNISFSTVQELIEAEVRVGDKEFLDKNTINGNIVEATCTKEKFSGLNLQDAVVIVEDREEIQKEAINKGAKMLIIAYDDDVSDEVASLAQEKNVVILRSEFPTYQIVSLLKQALPVSKIMSPTVVSLNATQTLDEALNTVKKYKYGSFPVLDENNKFMGLVSREEILAPEKKHNFILVDHNNISESPDGVTIDQVYGIVDHHKMSIKPPERITMQYGTCGANATNVAQAYWANRVELPSKMAGLLWCAIVSDTDNFTSLTTTQDDIDTAEELAKKAGIKNTDKFAKELLSKNDSEVLNLSPYNIVSKNDSKTVEMGKYGSIQIAQTKLGDADVFLREKQKELKTALEEFDENNKKLLGSVVIVTDRAKKCSYLIVSKKMQRIVKQALKKADSDFLAKKIKVREGEESKTYKEVLSAIAEVPLGQRIADFITKIGTDSKTEERDILAIPNVASRKEQIAPFFKEVIKLAYS
ncbi:MAG: CBS domain-containing protein [Candidatus Gastranaerophilales bacterium]|nr:CBS domain-containing protein [Candidatus Gastranaerophilales bacterium]